MGEDLNYNLPPMVKETLDEYVKNRRPTGDFLRCVLSNDLFGAIGRADEISIRFIREICSYIYCKIPSCCWGSDKKYYQWIDKSSDEAI